MTATPDPQDAAQWRSWFAAVADPPVDHAIADLYNRLDQQVRQRGPTCWTSGKCCNFNQYGHRLYVTGLEIAWVLGRVSQPGRPIDLAGPCTYQADKLCSIHASRPLGCRIYFCQQGTQEWQQDLYERFQTELRKLHEDFGLPYRYLEWRAGLAEALAVAQS